MLISGWAVFPLVYHIFPALPDRGYSFSRAFAWLIWGYTFWLLTSFRVLNNTGFSIAACLAVVVIISVLAMRHTNTSIRILYKQILGWLRLQIKYILTIEILFLFAFAGWAFIRSTNPEALGTEKPMELTFINAILRSDTFPPHDPWLSGFAISYYHFGYILVAMLARLTGVPGSYAFNLGLALIFGLSAIGMYGMIYNLLRGRRETFASWSPNVRAADKETTDGNNNVLPSPGGSKLIRHELYWRQVWSLSFLGPLFLLFASNLEGLLHSFHNRGVFWGQSQGGEMVSSFWRWLDIKDLNSPPASPQQWIPDQFWWWWRASRVVQDYDLLGRSREIIDEFPFFSFLLADLHPHMMAIPFSLLAISLALHQFLRSAGKGSIRIGPLLAFWTSWLVNFILPVLILGICGVLLFFPFYLGFSSQAGGLVVNLVNPTRGAHLWVMFAVLLTGIGAYLFFLSKQEPQSGDQKTILINSLLTGVSLVLGLFALSLILGWIAMLSQELRAYYLSSVAASNVGELFSQAILRRSTAPGGWLTLSLISGYTISLLVRMLNPKQSDGHPDLSIHLFILILIFAGCLLVLFPEFFFLRDQFGWRMNTIFKFYYQAWIIWAIAAAIRFLKDVPFSILAEAVSPTGGSYTMYARFATLTGLPGVLGWMGHESQWRGGSETMGTRQADIAKLYCAQRFDEMMSVIEQYNIQYIILGQLERTTYTQGSAYCPGGINETLIQQVLKPVFKTGEVAIFSAPGR
jgi:YYY domain-containing protein